MVIDVDARKRSLNTLFCRLTRSDRAPRGLGVANQVKARELEARQRRIDERHAEIERRLAEVENKADG